MAEEKPNSEASDDGEVEVTVEIPKLKHVERIRERIMRGQLSQVTGLRVVVSCLGENQHAVDQLLGKAGDELVAQLTDTILRHIGHGEKQPIDSRFSKTRRAATRRP